MVLKAGDKKLIVLRVLSEEAIAVNLTELIDKLKYDFKERTLRRWLNEMIQEGLISKVGQGKNTKYQFLSKKNERGQNAAGSCFSSDSLSAIEYVRKPLYERLPTSYNMQWFDSYQPNYTFYLSKEMREQLHSAGVRVNQDDPAGTYARHIFNRLLIDLSYNSSRLEGNTYSLLDTERLILTGTGAEGKLDEEKVMILNHKEAIRYLVDHASHLKVDLKTICTLHYLLAEGLVEPKYAGKVRDHWVRISGSTYIPYEDSRQLQLQLEKIADKAREIQDPFEQSLFLLIHVGYLQGFSDVNKRTARLCVNIPLIIQNLVPLSFNDVDRDDYMSATIAIYEMQDIRPLVDLFVFSYMRTCVAYDSTVQALGFDEVRVRFRQQRRAIIREVICRDLVGSSMQAYIESETKKAVPGEDQEAFIEDVIEDLEHMDQSRIAGLGITLEQLNDWLETSRV